MTRMRMTSLWVGLSLTVLSACDSFELPALSSLSFGGESPATLALLDGSITAAGPIGYCVDKSASDAGTGFAVLAPCVTLNGAGEAPARYALITMQFGSSGSAIVGNDPDAFATFVKTDEGKSILTDADNIRARTRDDYVIVSFDLPTPALEGLSGAETRAFLDVNSHFATVSVRRLTASPLSTDSADGLLDDVVGALRSANATVASDNS